MFNVSQSVQRFARTRDFVSGACAADMRKCIVIVLTLEPLINSQVVLVGGAKVYCVNGSGAE